MGVVCGWVQSVSMSESSDSSAGVLRVGLVQHACGEDVGANVERATGLVREAAAGGARVVVLQELFSTRYFPQVEDSVCFDLAEPVPGATTERLVGLAGELGVGLVVPVFERRAAGVYHNSAAVVGGGEDGGGEGLLGVYRKMHIPDDPRFYEKFYFTPGDAPGWRVFRVGGVRVGVLICWDQWFPEAARINAMLGAQLLVYPTAIGAWSGEPAGEPGRQREAWEVVQRGHAIANGVFVAACNRVGVEGEVRFWGSSFVADPGGRVIARGSEDGEEVVFADLDLSLIEGTRRDWPFFRDRRVDAFGGW